MEMRSDTVKRQRLTLRGGAGNTLIADVFTPRQVSQGVVVLAHGGGQTRHSWGATAKALAAHGWLGVAYDQRGHGDSDWIVDGAYGSEHYAHDLLAVVRQLEERGHGRPAVVGASLGGIAGMIAAGELDPTALRALVLVDVTPGMKPEGVDRVLSFMAAHADQGFASPREAGDAISAYLPHRPRPRNLAGLAKNLRLARTGAIAGTGIRAFSMPARTPPSTPRNSKTGSRRPPAGSPFQCSWCAAARASLWARRRPRRS
jgi:pimeloyl-ACP methyl ester carboxylesterase